MYLKKGLVENFPNLVNKKYIQVQEALSVPNKMNPKRFTQRYQWKCWKYKKERNLKATREKQVTYRGALIRLSVDFFSINFRGWREWHDLFKVLKGKKKNQTSHQEYSICTIFLESIYLIYAFIIYSIFSFSFWLTLLCVIGSRFIHLIRSESDMFLLMVE